MGGSWLAGTNRATIAHEIRFPNWLIPEDEVLLLPGYIQDFQMGWIVWTVRSFRSRASPQLFSHVCVPGILLRSPCGQSRLILCRIILYSCVLGKAISYFGFRYVSTNFQFLQHPIHLDHLIVNDAFGIKGLIRRKSCFNKIRRRKWTHNLLVQADTVQGSDTTEFSLCGESWYQGQRWYQWEKGRTFMELPPPPWPNEGERAFFQFKNRALWSLPVPEHAMNSVSRWKSSVFNHIFKQWQKKQIAKNHIFFHTTT